MFEGNGSTTGGYLFGKDGATYMAVSCMNLSKNGVLRLFLCFLCFQIDHIWVGVQ